MIFVRKMEAILCVQGMNGCNTKDSRFTQPYKCLGKQRSQGLVPKLSSAPRLVDLKDSSRSYLAPCMNPLSMLTAHKLCNTIVTSDLCFSPMFQISQFFSLRRKTKMDRLHCSWLFLNNAMDILEGVGGSRVLIIIGFARSQVKQSLNCQIFLTK